jgi:hypothetical protein
MHTQHVAPRRFLLGINFALWPTGDPHPTLGRGEKTSYCTNRVTVQWLSQTSCIFPVPAVVLGIHYFTPWRRSLHINDTVMWPTGGSRSTEIYTYVMGADVLKRFHGYYVAYLPCD